MTASFPCQCTGCKDEFCGKQYTTAAVKYCGAQVAGKPGYLRENNVCRRCYCSDCWGPMSACGCSGSGTSTVALVTTHVPPPAPQSQWDAHHAWQPSPPTPPALQSPQSQSDAWQQSQWPVIAHSDGRPRIPIFDVEDTLEALRAEVAGFRRRSEYDAVEMIKELRELRHDEVAKLQYDAAEIVKEVRDLRCETHRSLVDPAPILTSLRDVRAELRELRAEVVMLRRGNLVESSASSGFEVVETVVDTVVEPPVSVGLHSC